MTDAQILELAERWLSKTNTDMRECAAEMGIESPVKFNTAQMTIGDRDIRFDDDGSAYFVAGVAAGAGDLPDGMFDWAAIRSLRQGGSY